MSVGKRKMARGKEENPKRGGCQDVENGWKRNQSWYLRIDERGRVGQGQWGCFPKNEPIMF